MLSRFLPQGRREFLSLSEREILSLAIAAEEEDGAIYGAFAERLRAAYPGSAAIFEGMAAEEDTHRRFGHEQLAFQFDLAGPDLHVEPPRTP